MMKRGAEPGPSTALKRPRSDLEVPSDAFPADQKRRATDVCRAGPDGTGWIEGKVYQRGRTSGGYYEFVMTVELGSRVQVLLAGSYSGHFDELPMAVGAQVRIRTRGLVLEAVDNPPKLLLPKRFAWREGVTLHVHNPKTGQQGFVDTWTDSLPTPQDYGLRAASASIPESPNKIIQTPNPKCKEAGLTRPEAAAANSTTHETPFSSRIVVDGVEQANELSQRSAGSLQVQANSSDPQSDPQNPQSLPSPPPEVAQELDKDGNQNNDPGGGLAIQPVTTSEESPDGRAPLEQTAPVPPPVLLQSHATANSATADPSTKEPSRAPRESRVGPPKVRKRTQNDRKKLKKKLAKEEQRVDSALTNPLASKSAAAAADVDGDKEYWDDADDLPDEVLIHVTEQNNAALADIATAAVERPSNAKPETPPPQPAGDGNNQTDNADPLEALKMGCTAGFISYTPFARVQNTGTLNIMGVVESPGALSQTKTSEFMLRLVLYDPTNYGTAGFSVTLFEKAQTSLPKVETGDVLMFRTIQIDQFMGGYCAIGPSYKGWQWAVFHVKSGMLSSAPADTCALRHFKPEMSELQFGIRLGDWWRDVSSVTTFDPSIWRGGRGVREHKVIKDAAPEEYFDCTVEVLYGLRNDNGVHSVFVTDYTHNTAVSPTQGEWCPPRLAPFALQIEMWDSSAEVAPTMQPGEYYSIRNLRARISGGGYLEGKMQEGQKITKLDEDQLENQPRLAELLKRKAEWESEMNATGGVHEFPHQLIAEAEENHHFKCTVEVVHISPKDDFTYLYVTDYTPRTDIVPVSASIAPSTLADRVVRVELRDAQVDIAKNLEPGDFVAIRNLRLRPSGGGTLLAGRLGGDQRLITKLNSKATGNADLRALLSRKEELMKAQSKSKREGKQTAARAARQAAAEASGSKASASGRATVPVPRKGKSKQKQITTFEDVKANNRCPAVFRVRGRAVDFYPDDLRECIVLRCMSCNETLPKTRRRCTKCDDAMDDETSVEAFFQLWIRFADEDDTTIDVSVADERCSVLQDLSPDDVYEDDDAFAVLVARVQPLLGSLLDVSDSEARRRPLQQDKDEGSAPWMELTIGSWLPEGESDTAEARAYVLLKHALCDDDAQA